MPAVQLSLPKHNLFNVKLSLNTDVDNIRGSTSINKFHSRIPPGYIIQFVFPANRQT